MKKFLVGLLIMLLLLFALVLPGVIFGQIGYDACKIILSIVGIGVAAFAIGDMFLNK